VRRRKAIFVEKVKKEIRQEFSAEEGGGRAGHKGGGGRKDVRD
jgi:hypothetical protein